MPTAAKLVAAFGFALTTALLAWIYKETFLDARHPYSVIGGVSTAAAALMGWVFLGSSPGSGRIDSALAGLRSGLIAALCMAVLFAILALGRGMLRGTYTDPGVALKLLLEESVNIFLSFGHPLLIFVAVVGAALTGRFAGWAYIYWK